MKRALAFAPYPLASQPAYARWLRAGAVVTGITIAGGFALRGLVEPRVSVVAVGGVVLYWSVAFITRVLRYRFNQHNAWSYAAATEQEQQAWWRQHRQTAGLIESVLLTAACSKPTQVSGLFVADLKPPTTVDSIEGKAIRLPQVLAQEPAMRERELAVLLALQWQVQCKAASWVQPEACYWQGTVEAWQAFAQQLKQCFPDACLPEQSEPWQGIRSLEAIIDSLHDAPADTRILCAGCHSSPIDNDRALAAGEAAVLWLLGPTGRTQFARGEWYAAEADSLEAVAARALSQGQMDTPAKVCVSFSQHEALDLTALKWNLKPCQDANFGSLGGLEGMVVQTLAAWYAEQNDTPCAWLAADPHHTLTLGIVQPND